MNGLDVVRAHVLVFEVVTECPAWDSTKLESLCRIESEVRCSALACECMQGRCAGLLQTFDLLSRSREVSPGHHIAAAVVEDAHG